ncbi:MAG TPA: pitrilysin family protein [Kofleriaceae bacterium]|nr:pitrilysin family protein [Kofleriaceae bacterium]
MKLSRFVVGAALICAVPFAFAQQPTALRAPVPPAANSDPKLTFERYSLPNGIEVILVPDKSVPLVSVSVWYHVGSGYEVYGKSGFAHLFEHMVFQGSKHVGDDRHFEVLKKIGSEQVNGTTNSDRTNYFEVVPSNQLEAALWLESDRMGYLLEKLSETSLKNQIDVVRNERRQRYDNVPYGKARFALNAALYPEGHPYRYMTIGKHEDLEAASIDDVKNFFKTWYVPANSTIALTGDFEMPVAKKLVQKWFGSFPKSEKPKVVPVPAPTKLQEREVTVDDEFAKQRQIVFAWHSPANYADGDAELDIAANALMREGPGRLYKALVYDRPLATNVSAFQGGAQFSGVFQVTVTLRPEAKVDDVKKLVAAEIARLGKEPLSEKEIQRVIAGNESGVIRQLENLLARGEILQAYNHYLGDPGKLSWDLDRFRNTNAEKVRGVVATYLLPDRMVTIITNPVTKGGAK